MKQAKGQIKQVAGNRSQVAVKTCRNLQLATCNLFSLPFSVICAKLLLSCPRSSVDRAVASGAMRGRSSRPGGTSNQFHIWLVKYSAPPGEPLSRLSIHAERRLFVLARRRAVIGKVGSSSPYPRGKDPRETGCCFRP